MYDTVTDVHCGVDTFPLMLSSRLLIAQLPQSWLCEWLRHLVSRGEFSPSLPCY